MAKASSKEKKAINKENKNEVEKALKNSIDEITKAFGAGSIMKLGDNTHMNIETISTGSMNLDLALGGGVPRGRIIEIYGAESSGKTTLALHIIAEAQKLDGIVAFIDAEHALDPIYAKALGVDIDQLLISQPDYGEQALEIADSLVRSGAVDVIVVDSVAALVPKAEIDGEMADVQMGLHARLMSKGLRKLTGNLNKTKTMLIFINQVREKIGGFNPTGAIQTTTTGGRALKFFSSVRMEVKRIGSVKNGDEVIGNETTVKVTKNKVAPPFKEASFQILYGQGISKEGEYLTLAENLNIISKSGSWYSYGELRVQGKENLRDKIKEDADLYEKLKFDVAEAVKNSSKSKKDKIKEELETNEEVGFETNFDEQE